MHHTHSTTSLSRYPHKERGTLIKAQIGTELGPMVAVADDHGLYLLEFTDQPRLEHKMKQLQLQTQSTILPENNAIIASITQELAAYFHGNLREFHTPYHLRGTSFQKCAWEELLRTPYGHVRSYMAQAHAIGHPMAHRAVANANGANSLAIILPCHRIVQNNGALGGYGGGVTRKKWLLDHEQRHASCHPKSQHV